MTDPTNQKILEDRNLLAQQNKEYAESLAKDLLKKQEKEKKKKELKEKEDRKKIIEEYKLKMNGSKYDGNLSIMIKYPDGKKAVLGFASSDTLDKLFDGIMSHPSCPNYFFVRSVYPKMEINCFPSWYRDILNIEVDDVERKITVGEEMKTFDEQKIVNKTILYINIIH